MLNTLFNKHVMLHIESLVLHLKHSILYHAPSPLVSLGLTDLPNSGRGAFLLQCPKVALSIYHKLSLISIL